MDLMLYRGSLLAAIPLMLFFGLHMILARIPNKKNCQNYLFSRRLMGSALLVLTSNYLVHLLFVPRMNDQLVPILLNMMTYFLCYYNHQIEMRHVSKRNVLCSLKTKCA